MTKHTIDFPSMFEAAEATQEFCVELAKANLTAELSRRLYQLGKPRSRLDKKLGFRTACVAKMLHGDNNVTIETMGNVARALDSSIRFHLEPAGNSSHWFDAGTTSTLVQHAAHVEIPCTGRPWRSDLVITPPADDPPAAVAQEVTDETFSAGA